MTRLPTGWGQWCTISIRFSVPSLGLRLLGSLAVRRSYQARPAGTALGVSQLGTAVFDPGHCQAGLPRPVRLWKPCGCQGSLRLAWPLLLPPLSLSVGTRSPGLALERQLVTGGETLGLGSSPTPGLRAHGASSAVGLPSPPQRPMLDVGFSFLVLSRNGQGFLSLCFSTGWSAWGQPRTELSAPSPWRGGSRPSDLCSAASFYAVQLPCFASSGPEAP